MKNRLLSSIGILSLFLLALASLWLLCGPVRAQSPVDELLALINEARLSQGLYPYVISTELTLAAQRHSEDMAATGNIDHTGSDGSSSTQRVLEAGYGVYEFGLVASENIYGGTGGAEVPFSGWMDLPGARSNILHDKYREVGIGVANDAVGLTFWTLTVGARPNVLPVLVNEGAASVDTITVTLRLVPENAVPEGLGTAMGQPVAYRASLSSQFVGAEWETWAEQVTFVLDETPGRQTVYVQLRDAADRTAVSQTSVTLSDLDVTVTPTGAVETATPGTPAATLTISATPTPTPETLPTATGTATATATPTPTGTRTPIPTVSATPSPTASATVTPPPTASATHTPAPTETATSTPSPTEPPTIPPAPTGPPEPAVPLPEPTQPISPEVDEDEAEPASLASRVAPWALGLQIVALVLGVYVALRRPNAEVGDEDL